MLDAHFAMTERELLGDLSQLEVFVNGFFFRGDEAKISVWDHGLLYGWCFVYWGFSCVCW